MKLIHTSDIHIDSPLTARLSPAEARERKREIINSFRNIIDDARKIHAYGIIIAGDLFDNDRVGVRSLDFIIGVIEAAPDIMFFYLPGNHEKDRIISSGILLPENLKIFGEDWTYFKIENITIAGRSKISEDMFSSLSLYEKDLNIVTLHGELAASDTPEKISVRKLSKLPIDYLALGHYHTYSENRISNRCTAVYSGTPEGRGFDEVGYKGYVIIDTDSDTVTHRFVKRATRTLHSIRVDISGVEREIEIENRVADALYSIPSNDLVRIILTGEYEPGLRRDTESLSARFGAKYFYFEAKDQSKLRISADDYKNDKSLKGEFIRLVMSKEELSDDEKAAIIECGIRALAGEEL